MAASRERNELRPSPGARISHPFFMKRKPARKNTQKKPGNPGFFFLSAGAGRRAAAYRRRGVRRPARCQRGRGPWPRNGPPKRGNGIVSLRESLMLMRFVRGSPPSGGRFSSFGRRSARARRQRGRGPWPRNGPPKWGDDIVSLRESLMLMRFVRGSPPSGGRFPSFGRRSPRARRPARRRRRHPEWNAA